MKAARPYLVVRRRRGQDPALRTSSEKEKVVSRILSVVDLPWDNTKKYPLSIGDNTLQFGQQKRHVGSRNLSENSIGPKLLQQSLHSE